MKYTAAFLSLMLFATMGFAKDQTIKISTIINASEPASVEMMKLFRQKIGTHPNLFTLVNNDDASAGLLVECGC